MKLVFPTLEYKKAALEYRQEHIDCGEMHIHGSADLFKTDNYESWLDKITKFETTVPVGLVTSSTYFALIDDKIIGTISIRHKLNDWLIKYGGHIGYGVRPSERCKSYATKMLALALEKCKKFGIDKALITCNKENIGSAKTILNNGGILENEIIDENNNILQRYWISL